MSQAKLASLMSVDRSTVAKWEIDRHEPGPSLLSELSQILKVSMGWLTDEDAAEPNRVEVIQEPRFSTGFAATMAIRSWRGVMASIDSLDDCEFDTGGYEPRGTYRFSRAWPIQRRET